MKKLLLSVLLLGGLAAIAQAEQPKFAVPVSVNGVADPGLKSAGVDVAYVATSTNATLVTDRDGATITDGFIHWIVRPATGAANAYLELRDTATANVTATQLIPWVCPVSTAITANNQTSPILVFDPPLPFYSGLSVIVKPNGTPVAGNQYTIGIRWKKQ